MRRYAAILSYAVHACDVLLRICSVVCVRLSVLLHIKRKRVEEGIGRIDGDAETVRWHNLRGH